MNHGGPSCPHKTRKYLCEECDGGGVCLHNKQKQHCKDCGTMFYCKHKSSRNHCFKCSPRRWASGILRSARKSAKLRQHEPPNISTEDLIKLFEDFKNCWLCGGDFKSRVSPHLHHSHETGKVHGFCHPLCNQAEGMVLKL